MFRRKRFIIIHSIVLLILVAMLLMYECPTRKFFGFTCPGCGITTAYVSLLKLDFQQAFSYHPLFFTVAPSILYLAHRNKLKHRLGTKAEYILFSLLFIAFIITFLIRL